MDRCSLPYCIATIMEVQRLTCVAPSSLPHVANEDGQLGGYMIPKGTILFYNINAIHMDPEFWVDPKAFAPSRFLDGKNRKQFVPCGMGRRICLGDSLAEAELFIFCTLILQKFKIGLPINHEMPDPEKVAVGLIRAPKPFYVNIGAR